MKIRLDRLVDEIEIVRRERRAGGAKRAQRRQGMRGCRDEAGLPQRIDVFRRCTEQRHPLVPRYVEQRLWPGMEGRAVKQQQSRAGGKPPDQPVPHHPAQCREVEDAVTRPHIRVQTMLFEMLQHHAAGTMNDAFGRARRAG